MKVLLREGFALVEPVTKDKKDQPFISVSETPTDIFQVVVTAGDSFATPSDQVKIDGTGTPVDFDGRKLIKVNEDQIFAIINRKDGIDV